MPRPATGHFVIDEKVSKKERGQQKPINLFYCTEEKSSEAHAGN